MIDVVTTIEKNQLFGSYGHLSLLVPNRKLAIEPGQFGMLRPHQAFEPILRRAMAIYRVKSSPAGTHVEFIYQVFGRGTEALRRLVVGQTIDCLLPLGKPFQLDPVLVGGREALLVAGGVGSAALFLLAETLAKQGVSVRLFLGGRSAIDLIGLDDFIRIGCKVHVATNDGSRGVVGFVTHPLERFLLDHAQDVKAGKYVLYTCGPPLMLRRVAEIAGEVQLLGYASLEERMACGFGVCVGCVVGIKDTGAGLKGETDFDYQRICIEGPVFRCDQIVWE